MATLRKCKQKKISKIKPTSLKNWKKSFVKNYSNFKVID